MESGNSFPLLSMMQIFLVEKHLQNLWAANDTDMALVKALT